MHVLGASWGMEVLGLVGSQAEPLLSQEEGPGEGSPIAHTSYAVLLKQVTSLL